LFMASRLSYAIKTNATKLTRKKKYINSIIKIKRKDKDNRSLLFRI
jgi:hypothetical protein